MTEKKNKASKLPANYVPTVTLEGPDPVEGAWMQDYVLGMIDNYQRNVVEPARKSLGLPPLKPTNG